MGDLRVGDEARYRSSEGPLLGIVESLGAVATLRLRDGRILRVPSRELMRRTRAGKKARAYRALKRRGAA